MDANGYPRIDPRINPPLLQPPKLAGYRPTVFGGQWWNTIIDGKPFFTLWDVERMRRDPMVKFCLRVLRSPLYQVKRKVTANSPRIQRFVEEQFSKIWTTSLTKILRCFEWGFSTGETAYREENGHIIFDGLIETHPMDTRALLFDSGRYEGQVAGISVQLRTVFGGEAANRRFIYGHHAFWFCGESEFNQLFGRPRLADMYEPWLEKRGRNQAIDSRRLWFRKCAFRGDQMLYPVGTTDMGTPGNPNLVSNQDLAREIIEKAENGGVLALPNDTMPDQSGARQWEYTAPAANPDVPGMLEYPKALDIEIQHGAGIPPEIIQAAETGSGWSGRSIPALVFFTAEDEVANLVLTAVDRQVMRPLVRKNFGKSAKYSVANSSLADLVAKDPQAGASAVDVDGKGGSPARSRSQSQGVDLQAQGQRGSQPDSESPDDTAGSPWDLSHDAGLRQRVRELAASAYPELEPVDLDWNRYTGPHGGRGWQSAADPSDIRYQQERPSDADAEAKPSKLARLLHRFREVPKAVRKKASAVIARQYQKLESKYGPTGAKLVLGGMVALLPVPAPGSSLLPIALAEGIRRLRQTFDLGHEEAIGAETLAAAIRSALTLFYRQMGEKPPALDEAELKRVVGQILDRKADADPLDLGFTDLAWSYQQGERGGHLWVNSKTGEKRYQKERPTDSGETSEKPNAGPGAAGSEFAKIPAEHQEHVRAKLTAALKAPGAPESKQTLERFEALAKLNGIDGQAVLAELSGKPASGEKPKPPANQEQLLSQVHRGANNRLLNDAMGELQMGQQRHLEAIPKATLDQFDAHGTQTLKGLAELLNNGIDKGRELYSSPLSGINSNMGGYGVTVRDQPFIVLGHPGQTIKEGGIGGVLVDDLHAPDVAKLQEAFPWVKFVASKDAAKVLPRVATAGGKAVQYGQRQDLGWTIDLGFNPIKAIQEAGKRIAESGLPMPGYGQIFLKENGSGEVWYVGGDGDEDGIVELVQRELSAISGIDEVTIEAEAFPPRDGTWLQVYPEEKEWKEKARDLSHGSAQPAELHAALLDAMLQAAAKARDGDADAEDELDELANLAADQEELREALDLGWEAYGKSKTGKTRWKNSESGRVRYQEGRPGEKRERRERSDKRARELSEAALGHLLHPDHNEPLTKEHWQELADNLPELTVDALRNVRNRLLLSLPNAKRHAELVQAIQKHVAERLAPPKEPPAEEPKPEATPEKPEIRGEFIDALEQARQTDAKFKGEGRYEAEVWMKFRDKHPDEPLPSLSKAGAEYVADEYEAAGKPVPDEVATVLGKKPDKPEPKPEPEAQESHPETLPAEQAAAATPDVPTAAASEPPEPDPVSQPTTPEAKAAEQAEAAGDDPRQVAERFDEAQKKDEYAFARQSAIPNLGEDLLGSARHKRNEWRGLAEAEKNGSAQDLVTRDNLLKIEPHTLMATITPKNAVSSLAAHLALNTFPSHPFTENGYDSYKRTAERLSKANPDMSPPKTPEELRQQYFDAYMRIKEAAEKAANDPAADPAWVIQRIHETIRQTVNSLREQKRNKFGVEINHDPYNPVANALVDMHKRTQLPRYGGRLGSFRKTDVIARVYEFQERAKQAYPGLPTPETADKIAEHAKDVMEGDSFNKTFGTTKEKEKGFDPASLYVKHAERKGGRVVDAATVKAGSDFIANNLKMRGLQWGNSVTDDERQHHLQKSAEAFADLADVLGLPDAAMSLGGTLGMAIGARGKGNALAHYEPSTKVINLTRKNGVGSLAHEWGHALDNYIGGGSSTPSGHGTSGLAWSGTFLSNTHRHKNDEVAKAMRTVDDAMDSSGFTDRLRKAVRDDVRAGRLSQAKAEYWLSGHEMFARVFENYVGHKLESEGRKNTYLAGVAPHAFWANPEEVAKIAPAMDALMSAVKTKHFEEKKELGHETITVTIEREGAGEAAATPPAPDGRRPFTVAVDLDGTLAENLEPFDANRIGAPRKTLEGLDVAALMHRLHDAGACLIINTVRGDTELIKTWLTEHGIPFDYINENPYQPPDSSGKICADLYLDDRAINACDLAAAFQEALDKATEALPIAEVVEDEGGEPAAYGSCPICGARGESRERRTGGNITCSNGHTYPSANAVPAEPDALIPLKDITQPDGFSCGACCAMSVGLYRQVGPATLDEWKRVLGTTEAESTKPERIAEYFRECGCELDYRNEMSLEDLRGYWKQGWPVIVPVQEYMEGKEAGAIKADGEYGHFLVVIGFGPSGVVIVQDPSEDNVQLRSSGTDAAPGRAMIPEGKFLECWHDRQYVRCGIAVGPKTDTAGTPTDMAFSESDHPRDTDGTFVSKSQIAAATVDPITRQQIEAKLDPENRKKLDAQIEAHKAGGAEWRHGDKAAEVHAEGRHDPQAFRDIAEKKWQEWAAPDRIPRFPGDTRTHGDTLNNAHNFALGTLEEKYHKERLERDPAYRAWSDRQDAIEQERDDISPDLEDHEAANEALDKWDFQGAAIQADQNAEAAREKLRAIGATPKQLAAFDRAWNRGKAKFEKRAAKEGAKRDAAEKKLAVLRKQLEEMPKEPPDLPPEPEEKDLTELPDYPDREAYDSDEEHEKAVEGWEAKHQPELDAQQKQFDDWEDVVGTMWEEHDAKRDNLEERIGDLEADVPESPERSIEVMGDWMSRASDAFYDIVNGIFDRKLDAEPEPPEKSKPKAGRLDLGWIEAGTSGSGKKRWRNTETNQYRYQEMKPGTRSAVEDKPKGAPKASPEAAELPKPPSSWTSPAEIISHAAKMVAAHEADTHNQKLRSEYDQTVAERTKAREELGAAIAAGDMKRIAEADEKCRPLTERLQKFKEAFAHESRRSLILAFQVPPGQQARIRADTGPATSHATQNWQKASLFLEFVIAEKAVGPQYVTVRSTKGRAYYDNSGGIFTAAGDDPAISAHEFGHHLEGLPWVRERVAEFRSRRFNPADDVPMSSAFPQHGYAADEVGNPDQMLETLGGVETSRPMRGKFTRVAPPKSSVWASNSCIGIRYTLRRPTRNISG